MIDDAVRRRLESNPMIQKLLRDLQQDQLSDASRRAKADPKKNKMTRVMEKPMSYRYYSGGKNGKGQKVWFCWTCHRNVAGYYLGWRETYQKNGVVKRDMWSARKVRKRLTELAQRRSERMTGRAKG